MREKLTKAEKKSTELEVELTVATREKEDIERRWREEAHKNEVFDISTLEILNFPIPGRSERAERSSEEI